MTNIVSIILSKSILSAVIFSNLKNRKLNFIKTILSILSKPNELPRAVYSLFAGAVLTPILAILFYGYIFLSEICTKYYTRYYYNSVKNSPRAYCYSLYGRRAYYIKNIYLKDERGIYDKDQLITYYDSMQTSGHTYPPYIENNMSSEVPVFILGYPLENDSSIVEVVSIDTTHWEGYIRGYVDRRCIHKEPPPILR